MTPSKNNRFFLELLVPIAHTLMYSYTSTFVENSIQDAHDLNPNPNPTMVFPNPAYNLTVMYDNRTINLPSTRCSDR